MLTGPLVRVKFHRSRVIADYVDQNAPEHLGLAGELLEIVNGAVGKTRADIEQLIQDTWGEEPGNFLLRGLAKIVDDNCEFAGIDEPNPATVREALFRRAATRRSEGRFDRATVIIEVAQETGIDPQTLEDQMFADLKSEQRLTRVTPLTPERLLARYNVGLAQGILLKAVGVRVTIRGETPPRLRRLFSQIKFRRLICELAAGAPGEWLFRLDGPMSLFTATQKYAVQLAMLLPSILHCKDFELEADLLWGAGKTAKSFTLSSAEGLQSDRVEPGNYVPPEVAMFAELFRKKVSDWRLEEATEIIPIENSYWVPDFQLRHVASGKSIGFEILGAWRKSGAKAHMEKLGKLPAATFLTAISLALAVDAEELDDLPGVLRFRQFPPPDAVAGRAAQLLGIA